MKMVETASCRLSGGEIVETASCRLSGGEIVETASCRLSDNQQQNAVATLQQDAVATLQQDAVATLHPATTRYLAVISKPFTVMDFVVGTGLQINHAIGELDDATEAGKVNIIQDTGLANERVYVGIRPKRRNYYDFTPKRERLQQLYDCLKPQKALGVRELSTKAKMPTRTAFRYIQMLVHIGSALMQTEPTKRRDRAVFLKGRPIPNSIPRFFASGISMEKLNGGETPQTGAVSVPLTTPKPGTGSVPLPTPKRQNVKNPKPSKPKASGTLTAPPSKPKVSGTLTAPPQAPPELRRMRSTVMATAIKGRGWDYATLHDLMVTWGFGSSLKKLSLGELGDLLAIIKGELTPGEFRYGIGTLDAQGRYMWSLMLDAGWDFHRLRQWMLKHSSASQWNAISDSERRGIIAMLKKYVETASGGEVARLRDGEMVAPTSCRQENENETI